MSATLEDRCAKLMVVEYFMMLYFNIGFTDRDILNLLANQHHIILNIRTSKRICKALFTPKKEPD